MVNLVIALLAAGGVFAIFATFFSWYAALVPGVLAGLGAYLLLARNAMKQLQAIQEKAQKELMAQRIDRAVEILKGGFALEKRQFWVGSLIHGELGSLLYVKGDFEQAKPHLEQAMARSYWARAMLACYHFKKKDGAKMRAEFELAVKHGKKEGMLWSLYAYCLFKLGEKDEALKVLGRAVIENPTDEKLKSNLLALQNNKKMKMKAYEPQFYQFHIEPPPAQMGGGRRVVWERR